MQALRRETVVRSKIELHPIRVMTDSDDRDGLLVTIDAHLIAVLVHLDSPAHGELRGGWFLEAGFGPCDGPSKPVFHRLEEAQNWIATRVR
jgi:hypothetical protein